MPAKLTIAVLLTLPLYLSLGMADGGIDTESVHRVPVNSTSAVGTAGLLADGVRPGVDAGFSRRHCEHAAVSLSSDAGEVANMPLQHRLITRHTGSGIRSLAAAMGMVGCGVIKDGGTLPAQIDTDVNQGSQVRRMDPMVAGNRS